MKQTLINMIVYHNNRMKGMLIEHPIEAYVEKILEHANLQAYILQGHVVGFVAYYCNDPAHEIAFLSMLCIAPEYMGKGLGSHLLNCSIVDIKSKHFETYLLEVKEDNLSAIQLYKNAGFEIITKVDKTLKMRIAFNHEG